jgi:hypothetical protein
VKVTPSDDEYDDDGESDAGSSTKESITEKEKPGFVGAFYPRKLSGSISREKGKLSGATTEPSIVRTSVMRQPPHTDDRSSERQSDQNAANGRRRLQAYDGPEEPSKITQPKTHNRSSTVSFGLSKYPNARELSETVGSKTKEVVIIIVVAIFNLLIIILGRAMMDGIQMQLPPSAVQYAGGVVLELVLLISNVLTIYVMDIGATIFIANLLTSKKGYSLAVCGYIQSPPLMRLSFTNQLSLNSPCRKYLQRVAAWWIVVEFMKVLSPIGATGVISVPVRSTSDPIDCILFDSTVYIDRGYPTVESSNGVAGQYNEFLLKMNSQYLIIKVFFFSFFFVVGTALL